MINNALDEIVKCEIDISSPASSDAAFDTILLVVPGPETAGKIAIDGVITISKADELLDYGFKAEDAAYVAASVVFSQSPSPSELLACIRESAADMEGSEEGEAAGDSGGDGDGEGDRAADIIYEDIKTTLSNAARKSNFYGFHITEFRGADDVKAAVEWAEASEKMFAFEYTDYARCPVSSGNYYRSFGIYSGDADGYLADEQPAANKYAALAWMAKCFGYDPGTETWNLKELASVAPSALSSDQKKELKEKRINTFLRYAGANCTVGGHTLAGEWIDVIRFRDWLKAEMQMRVFNVMKANRKVPFTDNGIGLIEGAMESTLKDGQDIGGIAPAEYGSDGNEIPGFRVSVPKASELTEAERKSRKLSGCRYSARLAGAIHVVEIEGFLTF